MPANTQESHADVPVSTLGITAYTVARIAQASPPSVFTTLSPSAAPMERLFFDGGHWFVIHYEGWPDYLGGACVQGLAHKGLLG